MMPIVTVWPSKATNAFSSCFIENLKREGFDDRTWRNVDYSTTNSSSLSQELRDAFRTLIQFDTPVAVLNVVAIVPVFEDGSAEAIARLADTIAELPGRYAIHVFCLQRGIARALCVGDDEMNETTMLSNTKAIASTLASQPYRAYTIVVDDYISTGAPINFTMPLLSRFMATLMRAMGENYKSLFPNVSNPGHGNQVWAMGLTQARLDRSEVVDYMLRRAFVEALEQSGILQERIDITKATESAERCLSGVERFYENVLDEHICIMLDEGKTEGEIAAELPQLVRTEVERLRQNATMFIDDDSLSLVEKEATFAMLIGRDSERLSGYSFNGLEKVLDDVMIDPLNIYMGSYNELAVNTGLLPGRGECRYLKLPGVYVGKNLLPNPKNREVYNPLGDLKRLKTKIIDQTSFIRSREEELKRRRETAKTGGRLNEILVTKRVSDYNVAEQPLGDIYEPKAELELKQEVDLRKFCSPIRDQDDLGSCTSFAVAAMYEIIINAANSEKSGTFDKANLSERYLFYHSNVVTGRVQGGSNFCTLFEVMNKFGICAEELYPYTTTGLAAEPSDAAREDAKNHRVLHAKEIKLKRDGNKYENIKENHRLLTSALSEGYAVGFSLKIYNDFGSEPGGFVSAPTNPSDEESGYHAMVIVGYSEAWKCYIVRNSWGAHFGDKGYCYISSVYVDDPDYINFACIITETTEETTQIINVPTEIPNFGEMEDIAQIAALSTTIERSKVYRDNLKEELEAYLTYFASLQQRLGDPEIRKTIKNRRKQKLEEELDRKQKEKADLEAALPGKIEEFRKAQFQWAPALIRFILVRLLRGRLRRKEQRYRDSLQMEIDAVEMEIERIKRAAHEAQIKFYTAGVVVDETLTLRLELEERYQSLVSYNKNLAQWYKEDKERIACQTFKDEQMFIKITEKSVLDQYYEDNRSVICGKIDFIEEFKSYRLATMSLRTLRSRLEKRTRDTLEEIFADFSMRDYILQTKEYPYVINHPEELFDKLNNLAEPAVRCDIVEGTGRLLTINHDVNDPEVAKNLRDVFAQRFTSPLPQLLDTSDVETLTVFVTMLSSIDNLNL